MSSDSLDYMDESSPSMDTSTTVSVTSQTFSSPSGSASPVPESYCLEDEEGGEVEEHENEDEDEKENEKLEVEVEVEVAENNKESDLCSLDGFSLSISSASLLEETEADLPAPYSLARPLKYTLDTLTSYRALVRLARTMSNQSTCSSIKKTSLTKSDVLEDKEEIDLVPKCKKQEYLEQATFVQKSVAKQAAKALNLSIEKKFLGVEHLESEKILLLANLRYSAANQELDRVKVFGEVTETNGFAEVTLSDITFTVGKLAEKIHEKYVCTVTEKENVQCSPIVSEVFDGTLRFNHTFKLKNLTNDFVIYIELFRFHYKEAKNALLKMFLRKKLQKLSVGNLSKSLLDLTSSNSGFSFITCSELKLSNISNRVNEKCSINFSGNPRYPITGNSVSFFIKTELNMNLKHSGFLNVFKKPWQRNWFSLSGYYLDSWFYPEDEESQKPPIDSIFLPDIVSRVEKAEYGFCVRPNSFLMKTRENTEGILFSADSQKDMNKWIEILNLLVENIRLWKPHI